MYTAEQLIDNYSTTPWQLLDGYLPATVKSTLLDQQKLVQLVYDKEDLSLCPIVSTFLSQMHIWTPATTPCTHNASRPQMTSE
jgi:hypothetical protein